SHSSSRTRRPETAWNVTGVTNRLAPWLSTTWTVQPRSVSRRTRSGLLYAATPPVTPSSTFLGMGLDPSEGPPELAGVVMEIALLPAELTACGRRFRVLASSLRFCRARGHSRRA